LFEQQGCPGHPKLRLTTLQTCPIIPLRPTPSRPPAILCSRKIMPAMPYLGLLDAGLNVLMPVRVTQAKNIEYALRVTAALKAAGQRPRLIVTGPPDPHDAQSMACFRSLLALRQELGV